MDILTDIVSESEALRKCNLPSTPRWREFLRERLDFREAGGGKVYNEHAVNALAEKVADFASEIIPQGKCEPVSSNTREERRGLQTR